MDAPTSRPNLVLAMYRGLEKHLLLGEHWGRLEQATNVLSREPIDSFDRPGALDMLATADVVLGSWGCPTMDADLLDRVPGIRLFALMGGSMREQAGEEVVRRGITVTTAAAANARPVAEYTLAMILLANKDAFTMRERLRSGDRDPLVTGTFGDVGNTGCRVGLVGASLVGRLVIELLRPFDIEVAVTDPYLSASEAAMLGVAKVELDELLRTSRVVSIHAPCLPGTRGMIGRRQLALMPDGATLINTSRGALVDHGALEAEVVAGRLRAVLDVTEPEPLPRDSGWWQLPGAFITPHIAGSQGRELVRLADSAVTEVERFARGEPPLHPVLPGDLDRIA